MKKFFTVILALVSFMTSAMASGMSDYTKVNFNDKTDATVEITIGEVTPTSVEATFTPNESCASYSIYISTLADVELWTNMLGVTIDQLVMMWGVPLTSEHTYNWTDMIPDTEYFVYALPMDADGNTYSLVSEVVTTPSMGGAGTSVVALEVEVLTETSVKTIATPNEETSEYHYGLIEKSYYDSIGEVEALNIIREDGYPLYEIDEWIWLELEPKTDYYAISSGKNSNGEWGETTIVEFRTELENTTELKQNNIMMFPNPANTTLNVKSEYVGNTEIQIIDMTGRCVKKIGVSDAKDVNIDVSDLQRGMYIVNINGKVEKLVVE